MTVSRLREALNWVDGDLPVVLSKDPEGNGFRVLVDVDAARWHSGDGGWLDEDPDGGVPCVVLWPGEETDG